SFGGTILYLNETPLIRRTQMGEEPATNVLWGVDVNYRKESRLLTKILDKLPLYSTKESSSIQATGEYARMMPGSNRFVDKSGAGISYIDDFESVRTATDLGRQITSWKYGSTPVRFRQGITNPIELNHRRAKLAWYSIDNIFYRSSGAARPTNISQEDLANQYQRVIPFNEVFPNKDASAVNLPEQTFDLAYYPSERGMYNYNPNLNPDGTLPNPRNNFGAVMRPITTNTDFDAANIEYVEFWMMDPFVSGELGRVGDNTDGDRRRGELTFDLGTITEDALEDNLQAFENGLPTPGQQLVRTDTTRWGRVTKAPHITNAFGNTADARTAQDVGLDGLDDEGERQFLSNNDLNGRFLQQVQSKVSPDVYQEILADPAADNFQYYLGGDWDSRTEGAKILDRYKFFNNMQGNSPVASGNSLFTASGTQTPDNEDLNGDNTVSNSDQYYSYRIRISPEEFQTGRNYIVDKIQPGNNRAAWYLFRIPIRDLNHPNFAGRTGTISDFKSMRFMRATVSGFEVPVALRMVQFQMVASTWRPYPKPLTPPKAGLIDQDDATLVVGTANIEENGQVAENKVPYSVPSGVQRDRDVTSGVNRRLNEQSLSLCVDRLRDSDSKAVFKNTRLDFLNYKRIRAYISAYTSDPRTKDNEVSAFIRFGTDFTENFYEVEIPLKLIQTGTAGVDVWLAENELNITLDQLYAAKVRRNRDSIPLIMSSPSYPVDGSTQRISVTGNPDMNNAAVVMLGVRNNASADGRAKSVCVWFNELRVTDFEKNDGWAATGRVNVKLADLGTITASTRYVGIGFGSIEQKISERSRTEQLSYALSGSFQLDKFTPKKWGLRLPMYLSYERNLITPQYDQLNPDIKLTGSLQSFGEGDPRRDQYFGFQQDRTTRRAINFTNVGKNRMKQNKIPLPWDIENLNFTYTYNETRRTNINLEDNFQLNYTYGVGYNYTMKEFFIEPFKKVGFLKSSWFKLITDVNLNLVPNSINVRGDLNRTWAKTQQRSSNVFLTGESNPITPTFEKNFFFNRQYGVTYNPTRSIQLNYTSTAN
ncbi:MAG: cell surface protein SprA, partial [Flexibacteraceae bacterium]